ncbi:hypothetical protein [Streptomyces collinus]|uniref:Integral membrane protein n=1 Tax=Streptomyces collinus (strain DSM 40733 / Tue 365) TaxID=1214242 RepID=S5VYH3_STRC3|nr:hypothetical protein [Streptomyces collinus]AGS73040.1 hypothetical protein B446_31180 [Streptomyces collinus Tu 365]UJA11705.1 hypothetical protein HGI10_56850 [Streptomyces collinus]UJA13429.1 hypothetical protein HGI09_07250 [Streptomyces collinus]
MADSVADSVTAAGERCRQHGTREAVLFGGVYGAVLASSLVAALTQYGHTSAASRRYDALWLLVTAFASALAHGYAHYIAERTPQRRWEVLRSLADEWPLVMTVLPTVFLLAGAGWGWWRPNGIEYIAFGMNIAILFGLGLFTARGSGRGWVMAAVIGVMDAALGLIVVVANAFIK